MHSSDQDSLGMNGSGTDLKSGTLLTQPRSGFDLENTRRDLIALRVKYGADTPIGHRCSNIAELLDNGGPPELIAKQTAELKRLLAAQ